MWGWLSWLIDYVPMFRAFRDYLRVWARGIFDDIDKYQAEERAAFAHTVETGKGGFVTLRERKLNTRNVDDYDEILSDPERWPAFERDSIDAYFQDTVEMFPDLATVDPDLMRFVNERTRSRDANKDIDPYFEFPPDFFRIQVKMIEKRFPGGENNTIGDQDLRNIVASLHYMFRINFDRLVMERRAYLKRFCLYLWLGFIALSFVGGLSVLFAPNLMTLDGSAQAILCGGYVFVLLLIPILCWTYVGDKFDDMKNFFDVTVISSVGIVSEALKLRIQNCVSIIESIFARIENKKWEYVGAKSHPERPHESAKWEWPRESTKWVKLAFWVAYRVEYIDLFTQIQIWRIARTRAGIRARGRLRSYTYALTGIIALLFTAGLTAFLLLWNDMSWIKKAFSTGMPTIATLYQASNPNPVIVFLGLILYLCSAIFTIWILSHMTLHRALPDLNKIKNAVTAEHRQSFRDTKILKEIARFIQNALTSKLYDEERSNH